MSTAKIAISIEQSLLERIDRLVKEKIFPNRSKAIQEAVKEKITKLGKSRLAVECAKLDPVSEQSMADEGLKEDFESWPEY
ncbi:MAG: ribbon-helix-helix protein, CopG family [bacterium]|nr:ribbon-helix-helix protein, CopG family [bacterium]